MNPFFVTDFSISDSLKTVRKSVLIYETIIEEASGELIIQKVIDQELKVPVILCSSVNLRFSEIFGCVYYNKIRNWEDDLKLLINKLAYQNRRRN